MSGPIAGSDLELVTMGPDFLRVILSGGRSYGRGTNMVRLWEGWAETDYPATRVRLLQLEAMPELRPWLMYAVVRRPDRQMVGQVGFHSKPGPEYLMRVAPHAVEVGYAIFPPYQGLGYARTAVAALIERAHDRHRVNDFVASIGRENAVSRSVAKRLGFELLKEFEPDDPDREDTYLLRVGSADD